MKYLTGWTLGVITMFCVSVIVLHSNNEAWKKEAFKHYAAVYKGSAVTGEMEWMWFDDYARTQLFPKAKERAYSTPTPLPKERVHQPPITSSPNSLKL